MNDLDLVRAPRSGELEAWDRFRIKRSGEPGRWDLFRIRRSGLESMDPDLDLYKVLVKDLESYLKM